LVSKSIVIPNTALFTRDSATRVWLLDRASETVKPVEVKLGATTNDGVTVGEGLKTGDVVVTAGANLLQPGQRVRVIDGVVASANQLQSSSPENNGRKDDSSKKSKDSDSKMNAPENGANEKKAGK
jgi:hypothetical protein